METTGEGKSAVAAPDGKGRNKHKFYNVFQLYLCT